MSLYAALDPTLSALALSIALSFCWLTAMDYREHCRRMEAPPAIKPYSTGGHDDR